MEQLLAGVVQRGRQHRVSQMQQACLHALFEQGDGQHYTHHAYREQHHASGQPFGGYAAGGGGSADGVGREARRRHAGIVHADDGQAHHRGGDQPWRQGVLSGAQAERDVQRAP
ncbi:hypothetical protein NECAME_18852 [Necator americanus]|uniref:Uncharacterized protein n=1 Tax=Necator americanus TaxID=51031 RepID=W2SUR2_NECAM|nr:hypothetical protein NECAME_18852 [Necator americanus]ETN72437.1 hypothetical protein NECAME_18852 [Necator americanus]